MTTIEETRNHAETTDADASTSFPKSRESERKFTATKNPRVFWGEGPGADIPRNYHMVISGAPNTEKYSTDWLVNIHQPELDMYANGAIITEAILLEAKDQGRVKATSKKSFKVTITYNGSHEDLYSKKIWAKGLRYKRYRWPRRLPAERPKIIATAETTPESEELDTANKTDDAEVEETT